MKNGQVALALAGGYLLGRTHKMRWALTLAGLAAGSRIRPSGGGVGGKLLNSPEVGKLTQTVRDELLATGKSAALAAASHRIESLSDLMEKRASALRAGPGAEAEDEEDTDEEPRGEEEEEEEEEEAEEAEDEAEDEAEARPRKREDRQRPARKRAASGTSRSRTSGTRPARPAAEKKTGASGRKTASASSGSRSGEGRSTAGSGRPSRRSQG
jgi:hypothetical protein